MSLRWRWAVAVLALVAGLLTLDPAVVARASVRISVGQGLDELGRLAGVRDPSGRPIGDSPLPVEVVQEGGPLWIGPAVEAAVDGDPGFAVGGGPHQLRVEVIAAPRVIVMRLGVLRRGWTLGLPRPIVAWSVPSIALVAAALGALAVARGRRSWIGAVVAGACVQVGLQLLPWPAPGGTPDWTSRIARGPAATSVRHVAERLDDSATAIGLAVVAACVVLMIFDHRRSRGRGGGLLLAGLALTLGTLAWIEGAVRAGGLGLFSSASGVVAVVGTAGLWWIAIGTRRAHA